MKIKSALSKIKSSSKLIDRFKINEEAADTESRSLFQDFIRVYNNVVRSINEFKSQKNDLKLKEKELKKSVTKLSKVRKSAKKALRNSTKTPVRKTSNAEGTTTERRKKAQNKELRPAKRALRSSSKTPVLTLSKAKGKLDELGPDNGETAKSTANKNRGRRKATVAGK